MFSIEAVNYYLVWMGTCCEYFDFEGFIWYVLSQISLACLQIKNQFTTKMGELAAEKHVRYIISVEKVSYLSSF